MKIGQLLKEMNSLEMDAPIYHVSREFNSYRGYYDHLAMARSEGRQMPLISFYNVLADQIGSVYTGYKGGKYKMSEESELFVAEYGRLGMWVVGIEPYEDGYQLKVSEKDFNGF